MEFDLGSEQGGSLPLWAVILLLLVAAVAVALLG